MDSPASEQRILIVDDTRANITILVQALRAQYRLGVATSGAQALKYVTSHRPDLILLDIMMPEMDGYEVCRRLKASPRTRDIPVIFITALDEVGDKTRGFEAGAVDYITKPFDVAEVQARVRAHLQIVRYRRELEKQNQELRAARSQLEFRVRELEARDRLVHAQMSVSTSPEAAEIILEAVELVLGCTAAATYLLDEKQQRLQSAAQVGQPELPSQLPCSTGEHLVSRACAQGEPCPGEGGDVAVPLLYKRNPLGVLWVQDMPKAAGREQGLQSLWRLAGEASLVLRAARLAEELESGNLDVSSLLAL